MMPPRKGENYASGIIFFLTCVLLAASISIVPGCGRKSDTPEQQVRRFVAQVEEAAEQRDTSAIKKLIADGYSDDRKQIKQDLVRVAAGYFLRNKNVHVFTYIGGIQFPDPNKAELQVFAAMSGQPIPGTESLLDIRADLYRFDMTLARSDKKWLLVRSAWRPAEIEDFFPAD